MIKISTAAIAAMIALSAGCTTTTMKHDIIQSENVRVSVITSAKLPTLPNGMPQLARTTVGDGFCIIELAKYPQCLLHEIRHCFEGNWHEGRETTKDC